VERWAVGRRLEPGVHRRHRLDELEDDFAGPHVHDAKVREAPLQRAAQRLLDDLGAEDALHPLSS
jgi:hypothetical protein